MRPEDAGRWLATYNARKEALRKAQIPRRLRGPGVERDPPRRAQAASSRLFRKSTSTQLYAISGSG
eukprot:579144-Lingulodinium_polyedra.AAC.1